MITHPIKIDWRLVPVNTKIVILDANKFGVEEFSIQVPFDGLKLIGGFTKQNPNTKKIEQHNIEVFQEDLDNCYIYGVPDRLYDLKTSSKTILEVISESTLSMNDILPLNNVELKTALSLQVYRKSTCTVIGYNDTVMCIPLLTFKINPKQVILYLNDKDVIQLDIPSPILFEAIKKVLLFQAV